MLWFMIEDQPANLCSIRPSFSSIHLVQILPEGVPKPAKRHSLSGVLSWVWPRGLLSVRHAWNSSPGRRPSHMLEPPPFNVEAKTPLNDRPPSLRQSPSTHSFTLSCKLLHLAILRPPNWAGNLAQLGRSWFWSIKPGCLVESNRSALVCPY